MLRPASALAAVALALSSTACSKEDPDPGDPRTFADAPATSPTVGTGDENPDGPVHGYEIWLDSLARRDADDACKRQAPELTIALRQEAILVDRAELGDPCTTFEALLWEAPGFESEVAGIEVTQHTDEDALLAVSFASGTEHTVRMVYHRAEWRVFSTEPRTDTGADADTDAGTDAADGDGPARWVAAWCGLSPDQTRVEIIAAMGEPSGEYTVADGGEPQLWWAQDQYDFRVYLDPVDPDGAVLELVGDYDALSVEDRAVLTCPELRN